MADPLSLAASVLALIGAAEGAIKALKHVRNLSNAPEDFLALHNEISDFTIVLDHLQGYVSSIESSNPPVTQIQHVSALVERAHEKILHLKGETDRYALTSKRPTMQSFKLRAGWTMHKGRMNSLRRDLRDVKLNIMTMMTAFSGSQQSRMRVVVDDVLLATSSIRDGQTRIHDQTQALSEQVGLLNNAAQAYQPTESSTNLNDRVIEILRKFTNPGGFDTDSIYQAGDRQKASRPLLLVKAFTAQSLRQYHSASCKCACHSVHQYRSPRTLDAVLGLLFIGYSGWLSGGRKTPCTLTICGGHSPFKSSVEYIFPAWFVCGVSIASTISLTGNPAFGLSVIRARTGGSDIIRHVKANDFKALQSLYGTGAGSPIDVYEQGFTALSYAIKLRNFEMSEFLLKAGSDPYSKHGRLCSPYEATYDIVFANAEDLATKQSFQSLFPSQDCVEELGFYRIHQVVLGLLNIDLQEELSTSRRPETNCLDAQGRSALSWAALRGDHEAVKLLLEAGADANSTDHDGNTPLIYSVQGNKVSCLEILLGWGADALHKDHRGWNALLHVTNSTVGSGYIAPLLAAGINVNTRGANGASGLAQAAIRNNCDWISALLEAGADIESADDDGDTPLMETLFFSNDDALKLLLESKADYKKKDSYGDPILHEVAIYGGLRTIKIICEANLQDLDILATNKHGKTALELAREREVKPDGFVEAFENMLFGIEANVKHVAKPGATCIDGDAISCAESAEDQDEWFDAPSNQETG